MGDARIAPWNALCLPAGAGEWRNRIKRADASGHGRGRSQVATTPYAAYHFHRMAPYGVIANLFAMPVISAVSMPAGLLALLAMPFGFDAPLWRLMGVGIDWMIVVATWVAHLPGAVGRIAAFGTGPLLLATAGLIVLCLLRSPLRFAGLACALLAVVWAAAAPTCAC